MSVRVCKPYSGANIATTAAKTMETDAVSPIMLGVTSSRYPSRIMVGVLFRRLRVIAVNPTFAVTGTCCPYRMPWYHSGRENSRSRNALSHTPRDTNNHLNAPSDPGTRLVHFDGVGQSPDGSNSSSGLELMCDPHLRLPLAVQCGNGPALPE